MSSALASASAPDVERRKTPQMRARRRVLAVASMLLALTGGVIASTGTASAQTPPGACTHTCNNPPGGISAADWNAALQAADFWANHYIDFNGAVWYRFWEYRRLEHWAGHGWPGQATGQRWYGYFDNNQNAQFIYYGGTFNDYNGDVAAFEQNSPLTHASPSQAFSTGNGRTAPYVEYDMDSYNAPGTQRNARRIIRNTITGNTFVTYDHYKTFAYLGRF